MHYRKWRGNFPTLFPIKTAIATSRPISLIPSISGIDRGCTDWLKQSEKIYITDDSEIYWKYLRQTETNVVPSIAWFIHRMVPKAAVILHLLLSLFPSTLYPLKVHVRGTFFIVVIYIRIVYSKSAFLLTRVHRIDFATGILIWDPVQCHKRPQVRKTI